MLPEPKPLPVRRYEAETGEDGMAATRPGIVFASNMDIRRAATILTDAISRHSYIVVFGNCSVNYRGRGASRIGPGDRMVVVKPDGAVLVHRPSGYSPVNWQPDSQALTAEQQGDTLILRSVRGRPREVLEILFHDVYAVLVVEGLRDNAEFIEYLDEAELRDYLAANPDEIEEGLHVIRKERPIGTGYADIVARDREGRYVVIEVKRVTATREAVRQLHRYVEKLREENPAAPVRGILVAPSISREAKKLLESLGLEYRQVDVARIYQKAIERGEIKSDEKTRSLLDYFAPRSGDKEQQHSG